MGACLLEVRAWQLERSVMNSFGYAGHESPKRHERDEEVVGSGGAGMDSGLKRSYERQGRLGSSRQPTRTQHPVCGWLHSHRPH